MTVPPYVLGFAFDLPEKDAQSPLARVALIHKIKPDWQSGFMNGIGGKIEDSDLSAVYAMVREFYEETGYLTSVDHWEHFHTMGSEEWTVYCFKLFGVPLDELRTMEEEKVEIVQVSDLAHRKVLHNLRWLVPLAQDPQPYPCMQVYR